MKIQHLVVGRFLLDVKIVVYGENGNIKVPEVSFNVNENLNNGGKLNRLREYTFNYGDYFDIYHGHPSMFSITGGVNDKEKNIVMEFKTQKTY